MSPEALALVEIQNPEVTVTSEPLGLSCVRIGGEPVWAIQNRYDALALCDSITKALKAIEVEDEHWKSIAQDWEQNAERAYTEINRLKEQLKSERETERETIARIINRWSDIDDSLHTKDTLRRLADVVLSRSTE